jgi:MFS family permease
VSGTPERDASRALAVVSTAVLLAGSTWFSGTAAVPALRAAWSLGDAQAAWLTVAVQLEIITGTFVYAALNVADVWNARRVFAASALAGAACNAGFAWTSDGLGSALAFRYLTGLTLAGVYPVGMKIVASWFRDGLGWRLGVLVGALGIGTASPYLVRALGAGGDWRTLAGSASAASVAAAALVTFALRDGPFLRGRARFDLRAAARVFRDPSFRLVALGYFGHMWELYALWSLVLFFVAGRGWSASDSALVAFATVAAGALGCTGGGLLSRRIGERRSSRAPSAARSPGSRTRCRPRRSSRSSCAGGSSRSRTRRSSRRSPRATARPSTRRRRSRCRTASASRSRSRPCSCCRSWRRGSGGVGSSPCSRSDPRWVPWR